MADLKTEHRGYEIRFNENMDEWSCHELNLTNPRLLKLKDAINRVIQKLNKTKEVIPALLANDHTKPVEVVITGAGKENYDKTPRAWTLKPERGGGQQRSLEKLSILYLDTPENRAALSEVERLREESRRFTRLAYEAKAKIPHVTEADLARGTVKDDDA